MITQKTYINKPVTKTDTDLVIRALKQQRAHIPAEFYQTFQEESSPNILKLFKIIEARESSPTPSMRPTLP